MYDDQVTVPLVVRTPMGGRRGHGPTHSQSREVPPRHPEHLRRRGERVPRPARPVDERGRRRAAGLLHRKQTHVRPRQPPSRGWSGRSALCPRERGPIRPLTFSEAPAPTEASATIATYGGMVPVVLDAVTSDPRARDLPRGGCPRSFSRWSSTRSSVRSPAAERSSRPRARSREGSEPRSRHACRRRPGAISVRPVKARRGTTDHPSARPLEGRDAPHCTRRRGGDRRARGRETVRPCWRSS